MRIWAAILIVASWPLGMGMAKPAAECLAGFRGALIEGHFTGPLVCSASDATLVLVGRTAGYRFSIYDYRYRYLPPGGNVMHGGQKIVVFQGIRYVGQYALSPPPYTTVSVNGTHVVFQSRDTQETVRLDFSKNPPREVVIDGESHRFYR